MGLSLTGFLGTEILGDVQLLMQTVLYFGIVLFGMMTAIPLGETTVRIIDLVELLYIIYILYIELFPDHHAN